MGLLDADAVRRADRIRREVHELRERTARIEAMLETLLRAQGLPVPEPWTPASWAGQESPLPTGLAGGAAPGPEHGVDAEVRALAMNGEKIKAIKLLRERTGYGLKEAKDVVDRI